MRFLQSRRSGARALRTGVAAATIALTASLIAAHPAGAKDRQIRPVPPPANAKGVIVLFDGKEVTLKANWLRGDGKTPADWPVAKGAMTAKGDTIQTREHFQDYHLHLELMEPDMPNAKGQGKGNSGVFMQGQYEIQVLDSYGIADPGEGDAGAVYDEHAPLVNACKPPLVWQSFDYIYRAPRFGADGVKTENARITVIQNGLIVQNNTEIESPTYNHKVPDPKEPGPICLQFHGNPVQYRNIWIIPLPLKGASHY